jgi:hypothetical protein
MSSVAVVEQVSGCAVCVGTHAKQEGRPMRLRYRVGVLILALAAAAPTAAQQNEIGSVQTETQRRLAQGETQIPWVDLIGLVGLLGLLGLRRRHPEDGYHPSSIE